MIPLYPAESNHLLDIETLRRPEMRFFAAASARETLGCGGCWLHDDYAEIKRVYVNPQARGLGLAKKLMDRIEDEAARGRHDDCQARDRHPPTGGHRPLPQAGLCAARAFGDYPADDPNSVFMEKRLVTVAPFPLIEIAGPPFARGESYGAQATRADSPQRGALSRQAGEAGTDFRSHRRSRPPDPAGDAPLRRTLPRRNERHREGSRPCARRHCSGERAHRDRGPCETPGEAGRRLHRHRDPAVARVRRCTHPCAELGLAGRLRRDRRGAAHPARRRTGHPHLHGSRRSGAFGSQCRRPRHHGQLPRKRPGLPSGGRSPPAHPAAACWSSSTLRLRSRPSLPRPRPVPTT